MSIKEYLKSHHKSILDDLANFLSIKSISTNDEYQQDIQDIMIF